MAFFPPLSNDDGSPARILWASARFSRSSEPSSLLLMALKRELGFFDATMVVVGGIIGTGIFVNPYIVARGLDSTTLVLGAWFAGGVVAIIGALAYAELGQQQPEAGGPYVYLRDAWHPMAG